MLFPKHYRENSPKNENHYFCMTFFVRHKSRYFEKCLSVFVCIQLVANIQNQNSICFYFAWKKKAIQV